MKLTRQGVRDLDALGKPPVRGHRAAVATCRLPEDHEWSPWEENQYISLAGTLEFESVRTCLRCGTQDRRVHGLG